MFEYFISMLIKVGFILFLICIALAILTEVFDIIMAGILNICSLVKHIFSRK